MTTVEWVFFLFPWATWACSLIALRLAPLNGPPVSGIRALLWGYHWYGLLLGVSDLLWGMGWVSTAQYVIWRKVGGRVPLLVGILLLLWHWRIPRA